MHEPDVVAALVPLGFSLNESRAYGALLQGGTATGYEVGQRANIPRSAVYAVLRRLVKAGAARSVPGHDGSPERFTATPAETLLALLRKRFDASTSSFEEALRRLDTTPEAPDAYSVRGYVRVLEEAERLVGTAKERLVVSGWPREIALLAAELRKAVKRKVYLVVFSHAALPDVPGDVFSYGLDEPSRESFWKHRLVGVAAGQRWSSPTICARSSARRSKARKTAPSSAPRPRSPSSRPARWRSTSRCSRNDRAATSST
jgi:HTH-type transcriptional regulator, sugar sensing transcriptional regulator